MAYRAAGPGLIEVDPRYQGAGMLKALLHNFDFDDMALTDLKREHAEFLRTQAVPLLTENRGGVWLEGQASKVGVNDYNMVLSRRRVERVVPSSPLMGCCAPRSSPMPPVRSIPHPA